MKDKNNTLRHGYVQMNKLGIFIWKARKYNKFMLLIIKVHNKILSYQNKRTNTYYNSMY